MLKQVLNNQVLNKNLKVGKMQYIFNTLILNAESKEIIKFHKNCVKMFKPFLSTRKKIEYGIREGMFYKPHVTLYYGKHDNAKNLVEKYKNKSFNLEVTGAGLIHKTGMEGESDWETCRIIPV